MASGGLEAADPRVVLAAALALLLASAFKGTYYHRTGQTGIHCHPLTRERGSRAEVFTESHTAVILSCLLFTNPEDEGGSELAEVTACLGIKSLAFSSVLTTRPPQL